MTRTIVVLGGGIVGLNLAYFFAEQQANTEIYLLETEEYLGHHSTTRNSEVLHAGIAYPPDSLKARLCVEGNQKSRELFDKLKIPYRAGGKYVVATNAEEANALEKTVANALASHAIPLEHRTPEQVISAIPEMKKPVLAYFAPSTAMIDVSSYIRILDHALSQKKNVSLIHPCRVLSVDVAKQLLITERGEMPYDILINSAGLWADEIYKMCGGTRNFEIRPYKGEYYRWKNSKIKEVIYPVPHRFFASTHEAEKISSLGMHFHCNLGGEVLIGPSQELTTRKDDYSMTLPPEHFIEAVAPFLKEAPRVQDLEQAYAGNRPKLFEDGKPIGDFTIINENNVIHLLGIESPGLTAAPAIAEYVATLLEGEI